MMGEQFDIFARSGRVPAAKADPDTSHAAAAELEASGRRAQQRRKTLMALARWLSWGEPPTSAELAEGNVHLRFVYARRLPDLADQGLVERRPQRACRATGRQAITWHMTAAGRDALARRE